MVEEFFARGGVRQIGSFRGVVDEIIEFFVAILIPNHFDLVVINGVIALLIG